MEKLQDVPFTLIDRAAIVASGNLTPAVTPCKLPEVSVEATESCEVLTRIPWSVEMKAFKSRFTADRKLKTLNAEVKIHLALSLGFLRHVTCPLCALTCAIFDDGAPSETFIC